MINSIKIERFRCFNETELSGFRRLNLFGGKNNAGKTSLLEGIYLGLKADKKAIKQMRSKGNDEDSETYLHYKGEPNNPFTISVRAVPLGRLFKSVFEFNNSNSISIWDLKTNASEFDIQQMHNIANLFLSNNKLSFILAKDNQFPFEYNLSHQFNEADRRGESDEIFNSIN